MPSRLLIISNTAHCLREDQLVGHGPTVREIDALATQFDEVVHLGCLHIPPTEQAGMMLPYEAANVRFVALKPAGGKRLRDKLKIVTYIPAYARASLRLLRHADVVHLRCPSNVPMVALIVLALVRRPRRRWIKYAGNWAMPPGSAWSYRFQKWWIEHNLMRGRASVNGRWPDQPPHISSFINPCLTQAEVEEGRQTVKVKSLKGTLNLLFVGIINTPKGVGRALEIVARLRQRGCDLHFDIVGDGEERAAFEQQARDLNLNAHVTFHGAMSRADVSAMYARAHVLLFPTNSSEGWPKVLSEGMAYGVVPVTARISAIPYFLQKYQTGRALDPLVLDDFVEAILHYQANPDAWKQESERAQKAAPDFTYNAFLDDVCNLLAMERKR